MKESFALDALDQTMSLDSSMNEIEKNWLAEELDVALRLIAKELGPIGDDMEGAPEEMKEAKKRLEFYRLGCSARIRLVTSEPGNLLAARRLLEECVRDAQPGKLASLLSLGYPLDLGPALLVASELGRPRCAEMLADALLAADVELLDIRGEAGWSALSVSVVRGHDETTRALLVRFGFDLDSPEAMSALHLAEEARLRLISSLAGDTLSMINPKAQLLARTHKQEVASKVEAWIQKAQLDRVASAPASTHRSRSL